MNMNIKGHEQKVLIEGDWLTDGRGNFVKVITLPEGTNWDEVTDEAKKAWEEEHNPKTEEPIVEEE